MNVLTTINPAATGHPLTMSSREIAKLLEARHDNVKRTIERLVERGVIDIPPMEDVAVSATTPTGGHRTYTAKVYVLEQRDTLVVVAQLSPEFTGRVVDRWQELEDQVANMAPQVDLTDPASLRAVLLAQHGAQRLGDYRTR